MKPICVPCERFMRAKKTGFYFIEGMPREGWDGEQGKNSAGWVPYKVWVGDLYECPDCSAQTVVGVSRNRLSEHFEPNFNEIIMSTGAAQLMVKDC